ETEHVQKSAEWRADRRATILKFAGAAVFVVLPAFGAGQNLAWLIGLVAADAEGVTVARGYAGHRRFAWSDLDRVRVDSRTRFGARSAFLEVDAGESLFFFSRYDLGEDPDDVLKVIEEIHPDVIR